ncbi:MAG: serine hydrolase, partial [Planctomycetota bacterium]
HGALHSPHASTKIDTTLARGPNQLRPLLEKSEEHPDAPSLLLEVNRFAEIPPEEKPGSSYSYNNAGFNTLAGIIEKVSGSYKQHLRSRLYEPLGMSDSCNHEPDADHSRMSTVMKRQSDGTWKAGWTPGDAPDWPFPRGSGGMVSSAMDYAKFCQMLLNKGTYGGKRVLSEATVQAMTNPQSDHIAAAKSYGLGWVVSEEGGTFSHSGSDGTYVWVDPRTQVIGMLLTQTNGATQPRSAFRKMVEQACEGDAEPSPKLSRQADGFYKDIFMSGGKNLTSRKTLHAAESLGLEYEYYAGSDTTWQNHLLIGNEQDENGILLYPDGSPRFRMIYVNGGGATAHGKSLTKDGRNRLRQFYRLGGSYCGSCAGSFLSGRNVDAREERRLGYLHIFPYNTLNTGIKKTRVGHEIPTYSALLRYRDFGDDSAVDSVYHNNGNWLRLDEELSDVEVLALYDHPGHKVDGGAAIWSYQADDKSGRILNIGCHPEGSSEGELLKLTEACFLYALDGTGQAQLKGTLEIGHPRVMDSSSRDNQPSHTKIGDLQYHHFELEIPDGEKVATKIQLTSEEDVDLHLFLSRKSLAFRQQAEILDLRPGANKTLEQKLEPGRWFLSVYCATTLETINDPDSGFHRYIGNRSILNGASYTIRVD